MCTLAGQPLLYLAMHLAGQPLLYLCYVVAGQPLLYLAMRLAGQPLLYLCYAVAGQPPLAMHLGSEVCVKHTKLAPAHSIIMCGWNEGNIVSHNTLKMTPCNVVKRFLRNSYRAGTRARVGDGLELRSGVHEYYS